MNKEECQNEIRKHKEFVSKFLNLIIVKLLEISENHDKSKLEEPELSAFTEYTPKLSSTKYGSDEYKDILQKMRPAVKHHQENNRHHPEHFIDGIKGMNLVDLIEMLLDWKASSLRNKDGDILKSIELSQKRFGYSDELKQIMINTIKDFKLEK